MSNNRPIYFNIDNIDTLRKWNHFGPFDVGNIPWKFSIATSNPPPPDSNLQANQNPNDAMIRYQYYPAPTQRRTVDDDVADAAYRKIKKDTSENCLKICLRCNVGNKSNLWSCEASVRFTLHQLDDNVGNGDYSEVYDVKFDSQNQKFCVGDFIKWDFAVLPENGFVENECISVGVQITLKNVVGIHKKVWETFEEPKGNLTDVILVVEEKKLHVGKQILAMHSNYFNTLFFSDFAERDKSEIVIEEVGHSEFVDFLNMIYPSNAYIQANTVGHLLKLADRFEVASVLEKCENYLMKSDKVQLADKLKFAETYKFSVLQNHCIGQLQNSIEIRDLKRQSGFNYLSDGTSKLLFNRLLDLLDHEDTLPPAKRPRRNH